MDLDIGLNLEEIDYHKPTTCAKCGGVMVYKGVGEYACQDCHALDYDDYGKVRNYLEAHPGSNGRKVEQETGVSAKTIRALIKEQRLGFK